MSDQSGDELERQLRMALMRADLGLKQKQGFWETPRNIAILVGAVAALVATVAGMAGYRAGQTWSSTPTIIFQPGSIVVQQAAPASK